MTFVLLAGGLAGLGALLLVVLLVPQQRSAGADLSRIDAARVKVARSHGLAADRRHQGESPQLRRLGAPLRELAESRGLRLPGLRADLGMVGRSLETHLAMSAIGLVVGLLAPVVVGMLFAVVLGTGTGAPFALGLVGAVVGLVAPTMSMRSTAAERRRDFRHVVGSFLDLVSMNLAGGRGVPEALTSASSVSTGWAMVRLRDALENARLQGVTPWAALGELGEELDVDELRDLSAALSLVAEDGAKVRESLAARAASMRTRELADLEGRAQARSQSMLVAQLLLCVGFLVFLTYPAVARVLG